MKVYLKYFSISFIFFEIFGKLKWDTFIYKVSQKNQEPEYLGKYKFYRKVFQIKVVGLKKIYSLIYLLILSV